MESLRKLYSRRKDVMLESLQEHFGDSARWTSPRGGLFVWATLDERIDTTDLLALARKSEGVAFVPGRAAYMDGQRGSSSMRLNFAGVPEQDIREGIRRIGRGVRDQLGLLGTLTGSAAAPSPTSGQQQTAVEEPAAGAEEAPGQLADVVKLPRQVFLAKSTLFDVPVLGAVIRKLGQLPVHRNAADAALVLRDAEAGIRNGACVIFYPEATVTRDPAQWPMVAKTGAARLALTTGAPVVPVAHWGAQEILPYHSYRPRLVPRKTVHALAGPPVDLSAFEGQPLTSKVLHAATEAIMKDITGLLAQLRGEVPPAEPFHPAVARRKARQELRQLQQDQPVTDGSDNSGPAAGSSPSAATSATPAPDAAPDSGSTQATAP